VGDSEAELAEAREYLKATGFFCFSGFLAERTGYRRASDLGRAATETTFPSLNRKADELAQELVDRIEELG
jgi:chromosome partitioning protein